MRFLSLPSDLVLPILKDWIDLKSLLVHDSATSWCSLDRGVLLDLYFHAGFVFTSEISSLSAIKCVVYWPRKLKFCALEVKLGYSCHSKHLFQMELLPKHIQSLKIPATVPWMKFANQCLASGARLTCLEVYPPAYCIADRGDFIQEEDATETVFSIEPKRLSLLEYFGYMGMSHPHEFLGHLAKQHMLTWFYFTGHAKDDVPFQNVSDFINGHPKLRSFTVEGRCRVSLADALKIKPAANLTELVLVFSEPFSIALVLNILRLCPKMNMLDFSCDDGRVSLDKWHDWDSVAMLHYRSAVDVIKASEKEILAIMEHFPDCKEVHFRGFSNFSSEVVAQLSSDLVEFDIDGAPQLTTDAVWKLLGRCPQLKRVEVSRCPKVDVSLS